MSQTPRRLLIVTAGAVVAAWAVLYLVVITTAPLSYDPATESAAKVNREFALLLVIPTALWVAAAVLLRAIPAAAVAGRYRGSVPSAPGPGSSSWLSAAAIASGTVFIARDRPNAIVLSLAADHVIGRLLEAITP